MNQHNPQLTQQIQAIIAELVGLDSNSIEIESHLEEDLGLLDPDLLRLITRINHSFADLSLTMSDLDTNEVFTVGDLIQLVDDELSFA